MPPPSTPLRLPNCSWNPPEPPGISPLPPSSLEALECSASLTNAFESLVTTFDGDSLSSDRFQSFTFRKKHYRWDLHHKISYCDLILWHKILGSEPGFPSMKCWSPFHFDLLHREFLAGRTMGAFKLALEYQMPPVVVGSRSYVVSKERGRGPTEKSIYLELRYLTQSLRAELIWKYEVHSIIYQDYAWVTTNDRESFELGKMSRIDFLSLGRQIVGTPRGPGIVDLKADFPTRILEASLHTLREAMVYFGGKSNTPDW